jgi:hypothetical protein
MIFTTETLASGTLGVVGRLTIAELERRMAGRQAGWRC